MHLATKVPEARPIYDQRSRKEAKDPALVKIDAKHKTAPAFDRGLLFATERWFSPGCNLILIQQRAFLLFFAHRAIVQAVVFEVDLDERRAVADGALNQRLAQRVLDVALDGAA